MQLASNLKKIKISMEELNTLLKLGVYQNY